MDALSRNGSENATGSHLSNGLYTNALIYKTIFTALSGLIALSNGTVLLIYHINPRIRSAKNLLLASLALSDLSAGTVIIPVTLKCFGENEWSICLASSTLFRFLAFSTILHILAIIFEKYISILHPFRDVQKAHLRVVSACIWTATCVIAVLPLVWLTEKSSMNPDVVRKELVYFLVTFVFLFASPFVLIVFAQVRMFRAISRSLRQMDSAPVESIQLTTLASPPRSQCDSTDVPGSYKTSSSHNRKVLTAFALMLGTFTLCWSTWYLGIFLSYVDRKNFLTFSATLRGMFQILVFLPSLMNPLLYTYYKQDFRQALQALLKISLKTLCR